MKQILLLLMLAILLTACQRESFNASLHPHKIMHKLGASAIVGAALCSQLATTIGNEECGAHGLTATQARDAVDEVLKTTDVKSQGAWSARSDGYSRHYRYSKPGAYRDGFMMVIVTNEIIYVNWY